MLTAGAAGLTSLATLRREVYETLAQGLTFTLDTRVQLIMATVSQRTEQAELIAGERSLLSSLRVLTSAPENRNAKAAVREVLES